VSDNGCPDGALFWISGPRLSRQLFVEQGLLKPDAPDTRLSRSSGKVCVSFKTPSADFVLILTIIGRLRLFVHQLRRMKTLVLGVFECRDGRCYPDSDDCCLIPRIGASTAERAKRCSCTTNHFRRPSSRLGNPRMTSSSVLHWPDKGGRPPSARSQSVSRFPIHLKRRVWTIREEIGQCGARGDNGMCLKELLIL
jgi:hypothetical protein